ncbi:BlaI/MecI/CopY family transcriptional regulator [uncultured Gimesia sp.]|uniref:BlaI/MecI/CopY family transcriptional regulator n=1 Tax=uncultured Gimesia sp. TaxID=1678688 RepID=UPI0030D940B4|tara:strand:+ start:29024 stop:29392 length:369 start_codon:yes stop_codon:yes gene_type:complete
MNSKQLGRVQLQIMQVLWDRGRANAREITDALNKSNEIAHSTVQTLLRQLEAKQAVAHEVEERTFVFYPLIKENKVTRQATRDLINKIFDGSAAGLVAYLIENEKIPKSELQRLRKLINDEP